MWKSLKQTFDSPDAYVSLALGLAVVLVIGMIAFNYFRARVPSTAQNKTQPQVQEAQKPSTLPAKYVVREGDTLWTISEQFFKSGYNWVDIQKENNLVNPDYITGGETIIIPNVTPRPAPAGEISAASTTLQMQNRTYTVVHGDNLWTIAEKAYNGDGYMWVRIAKANNLVHPDIIHAGNILTLP